MKEQPASQMKLPKQYGMDPESGLSSARSGIQDDIKGEVVIMLKVAVVGVGHLGKEHARVYYELPDTELVAVVDEDLSKAQSLAQKFGCLAGADITDVPQDVEAVSVVVPTRAHYQVSKPLLNRGLHLLVEKPITETVAQAEELVGLARRLGVVLQVGHIERFNPAFKAIGAKLSDPRFVEVHRLAPFNPRGTDVGVVLDLMIHDIDILLHIVPSAVESFHAVGVNVLSPFEDIANVRVIFRNGCVANLTASRISKDSMRKFRIFQHNSYISLDYQKQQGMCYYKEGMNIRHEPISLEKAEPLKLELGSFVECVKTGQTPVVSAENARDALQLAMDIVRQIEEIKKIGDQ